MTDSKLDTKQALEDFDNFIFNIDDWGEELINKAEQQGVILDYSLDSLKELGRFIRNNKIINNRDNISDFANCWIYLGEVFRRIAKNSYWAVGLDNPNDMNYGLYYITGHDDNLSEFIPILYLNNFTLSDKNELSDDFFYDLVSFELNPVVPSLDSFPTEK